MTEPSQPSGAEAESVQADLEPDEVITGKVVDFLSNREVVMDVGKANGVKVGMRFVILGNEPVEYGEGDEKFTDVLEFPKSVVKVVRLSGERLSIGRTFRVIKGRPAYEIDNPAYMYRNLSFMAGMDMTKPTIKYDAIPDRLETFDVASGETVRGRADKVVRKGDTVRLTTGDEFL